MKIHQIVVVAAVVLTSFQTTHAATANVSCQSNPIKAHYTVTEYKNGKASSYPLEILRNQKNVIYNYPKAKLADVWRLEMKDQLGMSRYFHANKRAIDYTSADLSNVGNTNEWNKLFNMIDVTNEKATATNEKGCFTIRVYDSETRRVTFLPEYKLPQAIYIHEKGNKKALTKSFVLTKLTPSNRVETTLKNYSYYDAMDFADIGDNEADPFISRMINMGFIEHEEHSHSGDQSHDSHKHNGHKH